MCTENLYKKLKYKLNNNEIYTIDKIIGDQYIINGYTFTEQQLALFFIVAYAVTVFKYQGDEINTHYNIFNTTQMNANELYTALSRTTKYEHIHLDKRQVAKSYKFHDYTTEQNKMCNPNKGGKYGKSLIDEIRTKDGLYYIGSTTGDINKRLNEH